MGPSLNASPDILNLREDKINDQNQSVSSIDITVNSLMGITQAPEETKIQEDLNLTLNEIGE
jgi:hypothetical protein